MVNCRKTIATIKKYEVIMSKELTPRKLQEEFRTTRLPAFLVKNNPTLVDLKEAAEKGPHLHAGKGLSYLVEKRLPGIVPKMIENPDMPYLQAQQDLPELKKPVTRCCGLK